MGNAQSEEAEGGVTNTPQLQDQLVSPDANCNDKICTGGEMDTAQQKYSKLNPVPHENLLIDTDIIKALLQQQSPFSESTCSNQNTQCDSYVQQIFGKTLTENCKVIVTSPVNSTSQPPNKCYKQEVFQMVHKASQTNATEIGCNGTWETDDLKTSYDLQKVKSEVDKLRHENDRLKEALRHQEENKRELDVEKNNNIYGVIKREKRSVERQGVNTKNVHKETHRSSLETSVRESKNVNNVYSVKSNKDNSLQAQENISNDNITTLHQHSQVIETSHKKLSHAKHQNITSDNNNLPTRCDSRHEEIGTKAISDTNVQTYDVLPKTNDGVDSNDIYYAEKQHDLILSNIEEDNVSDNELILSNIEEDNVSDDLILSNIEEDNVSDDDVLSCESPTVSANGKGGFSFDDILKANLELLSDEDSDDDLFSKSHLYENNLPVKDSVIEPLNAVYVSRNGDNSKESAMQEEVHASVTNSTKFWEDKLTQMAKDKGVQEHNIDLDSMSIGNIQKTKLLWQEFGSTPNVGSDGKLMLLDNSGLDHKTKQHWLVHQSTGDLEACHPREFSPGKSLINEQDDKDSDNSNLDINEEILCNVQKTKLKWQEMMSSGQNSTSPSLRRRSHEEVANISLNSSQNSVYEENIGSISQKRLLWEELASKSTSDINAKSDQHEQDMRRLTLDLDSCEPKSSLSETRLKWQGIAESKMSTKYSPRKVKLVSKTEEELEAEFLSSDVMMTSISDVTNTKSKFERLMVKDSTETGNSCADTKTNAGLQIKKHSNFSSLRSKFEFENLQVNKNKDINVSQERKVCSPASQPDMVSSGENMILQLTDGEHMKNSADC